MSIEIHIGEASIHLSCDQSSRPAGDRGKRLTMVDYNFDDVLHAASRVGAAVLTTEESDKVSSVLSNLRRRLANGQLSGPLPDPDPLTTFRDHISATPNEKENGS